MIGHHTRLRENGDLPLWLGPGLCLNPTAQKDNRGVLGASFRVEQFTETVGYSNMADYTNHIICELQVVKLC